MSQPGMIWRHVIVNTHGSWLHGDERGFRSRGHRIHSSGDYKKPPPAGEHKKLYAYQKRRCPTEVTIPIELRPVVGRAIVRFLLDLKRRVVVVAVGKVHAHAIVELEDNLREVKRVIGEAKHLASRAVTHSLSGKLWSAGGKFVRIENDRHLKSAYEYDLYDQGARAWTWSFRNRSIEGMMGRKRPKKKLPR